MLASASAPMFLNPVGHETLSCTGSSLIFRFRPSPRGAYFWHHVPAITPDIGILCPLLIWPWMACMQAMQEQLPVFCSITVEISSCRAIGLHLVRSSWAIHSKGPRHLLTRALLVVYRSLVKQISPDKNMNLPCTTASFTVAGRSHDFVVLCQLAFSLRLIGCFCSSARNFTPGLPLPLVALACARGLRYATAPSDHSSRNRPCRSQAVSANLNFN